MKKVLFLFSLLLGMYFFAQRPLITKWSGSSITIRTIGGGNYTWRSESDPLINGSGTFATGLTTINFPSSGNYFVEYKPSASFRFVFNDTSVTKNITEITQWGDIKWNNDLSDMFSGCSNMNITATDTPDFSNVQNMSYLFYNCKNITTIPNIDKWNVSNVTNMTGLFAFAELFNEPINSWNTSNVISFAGIFWGAKSFNQPLNLWNTAKATNMADLFLGAANFNQSIASWDVSSVINMSSMFQGASLFNQNINNWNVSNVTDFTFMFSTANNYNMPLDQWNTKNAQSMRCMFWMTPKFNQSLKNWNTSKVTTMEEMFSGATNFNGEIDLWDVSNVTSMYRMFFGAKNFNQPIGSWNVSKVIYMESMFQFAENFNQSLQNWNVSNKVTMRFMFSNAKKFSQNLGKWILSPNGQYNEIFLNSGMNCGSYSQTLKGWAENSNQSNGVKLYGVGAFFGNAAIPYHDYLINNKNWVLNDSMDINCNVILSTAEKLFSKALIANPVNDILSIHSAEKIFNIEMYDTAGRLVKTFKTAGGNVSDLAKGVYIVKITTDSGITTQKIIKE